MAGITMNVSGLDTETIIQQLMEIERRPLVLLESRQQSIASRKSAWDSLSSKLSSISSKVTTLISSSTLNSKTASVKDSSVVNVTTTKSAQEAQYDIEITSLAASQIVRSMSYSSAESALGLSGTVTLNGQSISLTATDTLQSLAAKINATSDVGVSASVLKVSPDDVQLVLSAKETGLENQMSFEGEQSIWTALGVLVDSGGGVLEPNVVREAQDAVFTINGIQFTRSSNTVDDAIDGVTIELLQAKNSETGLGGSTSFEIGYDDQLIVDAMKGFVDEYNSFLDLVKSYNGWDPEERTGGLLFGDTLLQRLLSELRRVIFDEVKGSLPGFHFVGQIGLSTGTTFSRDGKLSLDEEALREALKENRDAVAILLGAKQVNVATASSGATATASSEYSADYAASSVIDGNTSSLLWGTPGGGWMDSTPGAFPDTLEINFGTARTIDRLTLHTVDSDAYPASAFGLKDFSFEYWDSSSSSWVNLASVTGNILGVATKSFEPVTTDKVRVIAESSNDGQHSRIVELQAFQENSGAFAKLQETIQKYTEIEGYLPLRKQQLDAQDRLLSRQIRDKERILEMRRESLVKQFSSLETLLSKMNAQGSWLSQQIAGLSTGG